MQPTESLHASSADVLVRKVGTFLLETNFDFIIFLDLMQLVSLWFGVINKKQTLFQ